MTAKRRNVVRILAIASQKRAFHIGIIGVVALYPNATKLWLTFRFSECHQCITSAPNIYFGVAMDDFTKIAAQVRGARALLGWSQAYLAEGINVRRAILAEFESGVCKPDALTLSTLVNELYAAGIVITDNGVEVLQWPLEPYVPTGCARVKRRAGRSLKLKVDAM